MLKEIEFLREQICLFRFFLDFDFQVIKAKGHANREVLLSFYFPRLNESLTRLLIEVDRFYFSLSDLNRLLQFPEDQRASIKDEIKSRQRALSMSYLLGVFIDQLFDPYFASIQNYALIYKDFFPNKFKQVQDSSDFFQHISVSRYNYRYQIESLQKLDERNADDLKIMIGIIKG